MTKVNGDLTEELLIARADVMAHVTDRQRRFLEAFASDGTITGASKRTGIPFSSHYYWLKQDGPQYDAYREAFGFNAELHAQSLESEMFRRAKAGVSDPASASLLMFALKSKRPSVYRDTQQVNIQNNMNFTGDIEQARARAISMRDAYALPATQAATPSVSSQVALDGTLGAQGDAAGATAPVREGGA